MAICVKHNPTDTAEGASSDKTKPAMHLLYTSIARVMYGLPIGNLSIGSTSIIIYWCMINLYYR